MNVQRVIIPTTPSKRDWLRATLGGLHLQQGVTIDEVMLIVDVKPWDRQYRYDDWISIIPDKFNPIIEILHPPMKPKRSHEAVNLAIKKTHESGNTRVLVMDDDYWMKTNDVLARLVAESEEGVFVTPAMFDEVREEERHLWMTPALEYEGVIEYFACQPRSKRIPCDLSERGQHPMCGHPKVFYTGDFLAEEGYDVASFQHYWWCDTDMYYRLKKRFVFKQIDVGVWHMDHPRYHAEMFQYPNARRFLEKHQAIGEIAEPHLDALNNQLGV